MASSIAMGFLVDITMVGRVLETWGTGAQTVQQ